MNGVWYGTLGSDIVGQGLKLCVGVWYGGPDMVGHVPTLLASASALAENKIYVYILRS